MAELSALIDPAWIEQALCATGKASMRRRKLPAEHAVWLVIGLALFRQMPLWQVVQEMALTLDGQELPAPSASVQARQRLGAEPLEHLFGLLTQAWGRAHPVHEETLRVLAVDGVVWSAPDSANNRQVLGSGQTQYGPQPWPMVRAVATSATIGLPVTAFGTVFHALRPLDGVTAPMLGSIHLPALIGIGFGSLIGAPIGARLASRLPGALLKKGFAPLLLILAVELVRH